MKSPETLHKYGLFLAQSASFHTYAMSGARSPELPSQNNAVEKSYDRSLGLEERIAINTEELRCISRLAALTPLEKISHATSSTVKSQ